MEDDFDAVNLAADWADISLGLRKALGQQLHSQWIKPIQLGTVCKETNSLDLYLPNEFSANWVRERFADRLSLAWKIARPDLDKVRIEVLPGRRQIPELRLGKGGQPGHAMGDRATAPITSAGRRRSSSRPGPRRCTAASRRGCTPRS